MNKPGIRSDWIRDKKELTPTVMDGLSIKAFKHPADMLESFGSEQTAIEAKDMFVRMLMLCIPTARRGGRDGGNEDRKVVGYRRMCVLTYICAPSFFQNMTKRELAQHLGITYRALKYEFNHVKSLLINNCKRNEQ